jgi:hypothetical protein
MEDSLHKKILSGNDGVRLKFSSIGAGLTPLHHAFTVRFVESGGLKESSIQLECWDNNIMVEIPLLDGMSKYQVGLSPQNLSNSTKHALPEVFGNKKEVEKTPKKYMSKKNTQRKFLLIKSNTKRNVIVPKKAMILCFPNLLTARLRTNLYKLVDTIFVELLKNLIRPQILKVS